MQARQSTIQPRLRRAAVTALTLCLLLSGVAIFAGACQGAGDRGSTATPEPTRTPKEQCRVSGGQWIMFNNGCLDTCEYRRGEVKFCTQARKLGCYCSGSRCWNGSRCEDV